MELRLPIGVRVIGLYIGNGIHVAQAILRIENAAKVFKDLVQEDFPEVNAATNAVLHTKDKADNDIYYGLNGQTISVGLSVRMNKHNWDFYVRKTEHFAVKSVTPEEVEAEGIIELLNTLDDQTKRINFGISEEEFENYEEEILKEATKPRPLD